MARLTWRCGPRATDVFFFFSPPKDSKNGRRDIEFDAVFETRHYWCTMACGVRNELVTCSVREPTCTLDVLLACAVTARPLCVERWFGCTSFLLTTGERLKAEWEG